jgi:phage terminase small subunit
MKLLNEKQRIFVRALFEAPKKHGAAVFAARSAGYGSPTSSPSSMASIAHRLCSDPKIQDAIQEESRKFVTTLGPLAVRALKNLVGTPAHRDHGRALGIIVDRVLPTQSTHTVKVEHEVGPRMASTAAALKHIADLAMKVGIDVRKLPPLIDATSTKSEVST